jgi:hypothetical protein
MVLALSKTLGQVERRTFLTVDVAIIYYEKGLRRVRFGGIDPTH